MSTVKIWKQSLANKKKALRNTVRKYALVPVQ